MAISYRADEAPFSLKGWYFYRVDNSKYSVDEIVQMAAWLRETLGDMQSMINPIGCWWGGKNPVQADSQNVYLIGFENQDDYFMFQLRWPE